MKSGATFRLSYLLGALAIVCAQINTTHADAKPKYGPAQNPRAVTLAQSHAYLRSSQHAAPDYWLMAGYYVPQFNGYSCSVASVAMILNAAHVRLYLKLPTTSSSRNKAYLQV